jgi:hypothetical protein
MGQFVAIFPAQGVLETLKALVLQELDPLKLQERYERLRMLDDYAINTLWRVCYHISEEFITLRN